MKEEVIDAGRSDQERKAHDIGKMVAEIKERVIISVHGVQGWVADSAKPEATQAIRRALTEGGLIEPELRKGRTPRFSIKNERHYVLANFKIGAEEDFKLLEKAHYMEVGEAIKLANPEETTAPKPGDGATRAF
jgi:hypothetical protein